MDPVKSESACVLYTMTEEEFNKEPTDEYSKNLVSVTPEDLNDGYNPGPSNPDGSVNFTCHCVAHLVASPCGNEFRAAAACQRAHTDEEFEQGACGDEFMSFMKCVVQTECFKSHNDEKQENE